jgi:hypothetical protein
MDWRVLSPIQWKLNPFMGVKQLGSGMEHPSPSDTEVEERVEQYIQSPPNHIFIPCYGVNCTSFTHIIRFDGFSTANSDWKTGENSMYWYLLYTKVMLYICDISLQQSTHSRTTLRWPQPHGLLIFNFHDTSHPTWPHRINTQLPPL